MAKTVIARNLPLTKKYNLVSVSHVDDFCSCENCGKAITNIATLESDGKRFYVGLDCMDTLLENNNLLEQSSYVEYLFSAKPAMVKAKSLRAKILKKQKEDANFTAKLVELKDGGFGFSFETQGTGSFAEYRQPLGWDYTFNPTYKDLTLSLVKGLFI